MPIRLHPGRGCIVACPYRSLGMNLGRRRARTPGDRNRPGRRDGPTAFLRVPLAVRRSCFRLAGGARPACHSCPCPPAAGPGKPHVLAAGLRMLPSVGTPIKREINSAVGQGIGLSRGTGYCFPLAETRISDNVSFRKDFVDEAGQETPPQRDKAATRSDGRHDDPARGGATTPGTGARASPRLSAEPRETLD